MILGTCHFLESLHTFDTFRNFPFFLILAKSLRMKYKEKEVKGLSNSKDRIFIVPNVPFF